MASSAPEKEWKARGVHLVGSLRSPDDADDAKYDPPSANDTFQFIAFNLPGRCKRMPDGEPASRNDYINCQDTVFARSPWIFNDYERQKRLIAVPANASDLTIHLDPVRYDEWALDSFRDFHELRDHTETLGRYPGPRFQVCLPSPLNVIARFVHPDYQERVEATYESMLLAALERMQTDIIHHAELAIQFDCALEFALLENVHGPGDMWKPWFAVSVDALAERVARVARAVRPDVELGLHLCYGDMYHRHFKEPEDTGKLVEFANALAAKLSRPLDFVHLPVPKERDDEAYFAPLRGLRLSEKTEIYLGLVHPRDLEGTERRIRAARKVLSEFGVATECGWGRTPPGDVRSIIEISKEVSDPVI